METQNPRLYNVDKKYLQYLHREDSRVSVKFNNRPFAGIVATIDSQKQVIPLTSQTTQERKKEGKKKRSPLITTFITETSGEEIANLLYNNMIPVSENLLQPLVIDSEKNTYELNEIRFLRKKWKEIEKKAGVVFNQRYDECSHNFQFLNQTCCDFKKLENAMKHFSLDSQNQFW